MDEYLWGAIRKRMHGREGMEEEAKREVREEGGRGKAFVDGVGG